MIDKSELLEYFLSEAVDHIHILENGFSELEESTDKAYLIEELFRVAHTLKGSAALVKLTITSTIAHKMEDILEGLMNKRIEASNKVVEVLSYMLDGIRSLITRVSKGYDEYLETEQIILQRAEEVLTDEQATAIDSDIDVSEIIHPLSSSLKSQEIIDSQAPQTSDIHKIGNSGIQKMGEQFGKRREDSEFFIGNFVKVDSEKIEEMLNLIGEVTIKKNYLLQKAKNIVDISDAIFFTGRRLLIEVSDFAERHSYSLPENVKYIDPLLSEFGELEFDRYDQLNLFSRKLQEITNDITEALKELNNFFEVFSDDLKSMDGMIKMLKSDLTDSRMVDIGILFHRFVKPVKDVAKTHNKKIELLISGSLTKIDRVVFERLFNPLMHLIMNAISHGIESAGERIQKNKKAVGTITLSARKEGGTAVIEVTDDGSGIDTENIFKEAVKQGLLSAEDKPSKEDIIPLIFIPGFSTADTTDMASGRGMGMSAVRRMIAGINGILEVSTEGDKGTTFRIKVPLSLAISNVLLFRCNMLEFVMPSSFIEEVLLLSDAPEKGLIDFRGRKIKVIELSNLLGIRAKSDSSEKYAIVCNVSDKKVGLIVDTVIGQEETIIKTMHGFFEGLQVYSGTTISGDGSIRFVLNPINIFEEHTQLVSSVYTSLKDYAGSKSILIVDDSLSVRKYISLSLEAKNFRVYAASNGIEALNILYETPVDMIITDLEMPIMHGYEFISRIKSSDKLESIPIVVLTSRSGEKHKEKALAMGAEDYLVKPFEEESLFNILRKHFMLSFA